MKLSLKTALLLLVPGIVAVTVSPAAAFVYTPYPASLVQNGSFEQGAAFWNWTVNLGIFVGYPSAADGKNFADAYGTVYQQLATVPDQQYVLQFALAGNFNMGGPPAVVDVLWGGVNVGSAIWYPGSHTILNPGWVWTDLTVTATSSSTLLTFENANAPGNDGMIIDLDAISLVPTPEPATPFLLGLGFLLLVAGRHFLRAGKKQNSP